MYITIYCISTQTTEVNQTAEPLKLTHRTTPAWGSIEPRLKATGIDLSASEHYFVLDMRDERIKLR